MPKYRIKSPTGETFEVTAPDGASESDVMAYAQAQFAKKPDFSDVATSFSTTEGARKPARPRDTSPAALTGISDEQMRPEGYLSHWGRNAGDFAQATGHNVMGFLHGSANTLMEGGTRAVELAAKGAPMTFGGLLMEGGTRAVELATKNAPMTFGDLAQVMRKQTGADQAATRANEQQYQQDVPNSPASFAGAAVGQILPWTVGAPAKLMTAVGAKGPGLIAKLSGAARQGAVIGAASPVTQEGDFVDQKAAQIGTGALLGAGGQAAFMTPAAAKQAVRWAARGGETGRQQMAQSIQQFDRAGTSPTLGQVSPRARAQYAEAGLRNAPGAASVVRRRLEGQSEELGQQVENLAGRLSPAQGAERGGKAIEAGITGPSGFMQRFKQESAKLYAQVDQQIPKGTPVNASETQRTLANLTTPIPGAKQTSQTLMNGKVNAIAQAFSEDLAAGQGRISYDAMKQLRSQIGEMIGDTTLTVDTPTRQLRQLYAAMSEDLTQAAVATNNPQAISAAKRASAHYKAGMGRVEEVERVLDRSGGPEAVYRAMFSNSREGGTTLRKVMQSLDGKSQRDLAAVTLRRLGRANPSAQDDLGEVFSPTTFLTNWNKMAPEAKRALFDRFGTGFRDDLDTIAATTSKMRDAAQILPNPSGTAPAAAQATAYGTIATSLAMMQPQVAAGVAGAMGAANVSARAFTSPKVVKWLAQQTKLPASSLPAQLAVLAQLAKTDDGAAELHQQLTQAQN